MKTKEEIQQEKRKAAFEKAKVNKANYDFHRELMVKHLCFGDRSYYDDLKVFADTQVIDNMLLLKLMAYAEEYAAKSRPIKLTKDNVPEGEVIGFTKDGYAFNGKIRYDNERFSLHDFDGYSEATVTHFMYKPEIME